MEHPKKIEHMRNRLKQGLTYREVGPEFDMSKSKAHRLLAQAITKKDDQKDDLDLDEDIIDDDDR